MNIRNLPFHLGLGFALAIAGIVSQVPLVSAQSGNQSNITGPIMSTSDIVGGFNFSGGGDRRRIIAFQTTAIQNSVNVAAVSINQQLVRGTLPLVSNDPSPQTPIPANIQQNLAAIVTNSGNVDASITLIVNELVSAGADRTLTQNMVYEFRGLTSGGKVRAAKLLAVIRAYNAFIDGCPAEVFTNNPNALRGKRAILAILLNAARNR